MSGEYRTPELYGNLDMRLQLHQVSTQSAEVLQEELMSQYQHREVLGKAIRGGLRFVQEGKQYVATHGVGETHIWGFCGKSGGGKKTAMGQAIAEVLFDPDLHQTVQLHGSSLEIATLTLGMSLKELRERDVISKDVPWGKFDPIHFSMASGLASNAVGYSIFQRKPGEVPPTRIIFVSGVGIIDVNPLDPEDQRFPHKFDLFGSIFQSLGQSGFNNFRIMGVVPEDKVQERAANNRDALWTSPPEQVVNEVWAENATHIDTSQTAGELRYAMGNRYAMEWTNRDIREHMEMAGFWTSTSDPIARTEAEKKYMNELMDRWKIRKKNRHIETNRFLTAETVHYYHQLVNNLAFPLSAVRYNSKGF